jgi:hypothetical protein
VNFYEDWSSDAKLDLILIFSPFFFFENCLLSTQRKNDCSKYQIALSDINYLPINMEENYSENNYVKCIEILQISAVGMKDRSRKEVNAHKNNSRVITFIPTILYCLFWVKVKLA